MARNDQNDEMTGKTAPDFTLPDADGRPARLADWRGRWLVLYFYPKDDTPGCTLEAMDFTRLLNDFQALDADVAGISRDTPEKHCRFAERHQLKVRLLSDPDHAVHDRYGAWGVKKFMGRTMEGALRTTFLIDPEGRVAAVWRKVKAIGHAQEVLETLKKLHD